jgi:hypothetical protein
MAEAAHVGLKKGGPQTPEFYHSKIATADFYFKSGGLACGAVPR